ncbi:MAG: ferrous iron transporter B [Planctomycetia bacterium]|nr:ferrous iron transporter B [Planctomycetia bacterium]
MSEGKPTADDDEPLTAALVGNPNTGKSTLFTALAGIPTRIGNYPGVTVEEKVGRFRHAGRTVDLVDLPGAYSLRPQSPDEQVAVDVLRGTMPGVPKPDCVIVVVDAANLARNLFLASQVLDLGLPTVVALTLGDLAADKGISVAADPLARRLGCPVIPVVAPHGTGIAHLRDALLAAADGPPPPPPDLGPHLASTDASRPAAARDAIARYAWIDDVVADVVRCSPRRGRSQAEAIDAVLTHRVWGTLVFALVMLALFTSIFRFAAPAMDLISAGMDAIAARVEATLPEGPLRSLLVDGVLAGVGGVVVFVPQIALLFLFIAILEGCGYLSRAAFLMDRLLVGAGLSGKSFIPLLSSFACAIPGIMAARTIENRRDRLLTILVAPLMSCSARLPVYLLLCGAFVPDVAVGVAWLRLPAVVLVAMYALGVAVAAAVALLLSRTVFRGPPQPFVMELPGWRWPQPAVVLERVREAAWSFLRNAGTLILAMSVVLWALGSYPKPVLPADAALTAAEERGEALRQSFLGRAGRAIEPLVRPLGWDWRIGCAALASFPAREVVLGTLGVIYNLGDVDPGEEEGATMLVRRLKAATWDGSERKVFTLPVALSIMVFFALCAQCASTLAVIGRETGSWVWPAVTFAYMTALAWLGAFAIYQLGTALGW